MYLQYIRNNRSNIEIISVYVDDLGLFVNMKEGMAQVKGELNGKFPMTDLGEMCHDLIILISN